MWIVVFGRATQFLLALVMMRVATEFLPPQEIGRMSLIMTSTTFFALFLINPVGMFINRRLHTWNDNGRVQIYLKYYWTYLLFISAFAGFCLIFIYNLELINYQTSLFWLLVLVCGSLLFNTINQTVIPSLNLLGFREWFIFLTLCTVIVSFISALIMVVSIQAQAEFWLLGLLVGQTILSIIGIKIFFSKLKFNSNINNSKPLQNKLTKDNILTLYRFAWPVAISVGLGWVQCQGYRFMLDNMLGLQSLGLFVAGYGISLGIIVAFESIFTTYFQPEFYKKISGSNRDVQSQAWTDYANTIFPSLLLLLFFIIALAPELTRILLAEKYHSAVQFVIWGALAEVIRVLIGVYILGAHAIMNTRLLIAPNAVGAIFTIGLILVMVPRMGITGVGASLTIAGILALITVHSILKSRLTINLPYKYISYSIAMGCGLVTISTLIKSLISEIVSIEATLIYIAIMGIIFLGLLYILLSPVLHKVESVK
jgi:O-antigen/teichoic acid export membrane protein